MMLVRIAAFASRRTLEADGAMHDASAGSIIDDKTGAPYYRVLINIPEGVTC